MFTKTEKTILNALPKEYKYIFRDLSGSLRISGSFADDGYFLSFCEFNHLFKDVKPGGEPICFRKPILDDVEKEYLKAVFKPFASRIKCVKKQQCKEMWEGNEYIRVIMTHPVADNAYLPVFKAGTMYKGMNPDQGYTLEELGISYD